MLLLIGSSFSTSKKYPHNENALKNADQVPRLIPQSTHSSLNYVDFYNGVHTRSYLLILKITVL